MKEGLDCAGAEELCKEQHSQLPLRYMIDLQCCVGRKGRRGGGRGEEKEERWREGEGGGGRMWREGGKLENSSYRLYSSTHPCTQASP